MGCSNSKPEKSVVKSTEQPAIVRDGSLKPVPLTALEIQARIECPTEMKLLEIGGFKMKYAWVSQRGYYPDCESYILIYILRSDIIFLF